MNFDRDTFYDGYRKRFGQIKHDYQVAGMNRLLTGFETYYGWWDDVRQIANAMSQVGWETAESYTPCVEGYYLGDENAPNYFQGNTELVRRFQRKLRYYPDFGRGDVQLTWPNNYHDMDARIRKYFPERVDEFESRTGQEFSLIHRPDQALDGWISFCCFTIGMYLGTFRPGHTLDRYITPSMADHNRARNIVNGDRHHIPRGSQMSIGQIIEARAVAFTKILNSSMTTARTVVFPDLQDGVHLDSPAAVPTHEQPAETPTPVVEQRPVIPETPPTPPIEPPSASGLDEGVATEITSTQTQRTPEGEQTLSATVTQPSGDAPDAPPSHFLDIRDFRPWASKWLKRIWSGGFGGLNVTQFSGNALAAFTDSQNWYIYVGVAIGLLIIFLVVAAIVSVPFIIMWFRSDKKVGEAKLVSSRSFVDPNAWNLGLRIAEIR